MASTASFLDSLPPSPLNSYAALADGGVRLTQDDIAAIANSRSRVSESQTDDASSESSSGDGAVVFIDAEENFQGGSQSMNKDSNDDGAVSNLSTGTFVPHLSSAQDLSHQLADLDIENPADANDAHEAEHDRRETTYNSSINAHQPAVRQIGFAPESRRDQEQRNSHMLQTLQDQRTLSQIYEALQIPSSPATAIITRARVVDLAVNHMFSTYSNIYPLDTNWAAGADIFDAFALATGFYIGFGEFIWNDESEASQEILDHRIDGLEALFGTLRARNFRRGGTRRTSSELLQMLLSDRGEAPKSATHVEAGRSVQDTGSGSGQSGIANPGTTNITNDFTSDPTHVPSTSPADNEWNIEAQNEARNEANERSLQNLFLELGIFQHYTDDLTASNFRDFISQFAFETFAAFGEPLSEFGPNITQPTEWELQPIASSVVAGSGGIVLWPDMRDSKARDKKWKLLLRYLAVLCKLPIERNDLVYTSRQLFYELLESRPEVPKKQLPVEDAFADEDDDDATLFSDTLNDSNGSDGDNSDAGNDGNHKDDDDDDDPAPGSSESSDHDNQSNNDESVDVLSNIGINKKIYDPEHPPVKCTVLDNNNKPCGLLWPSMPGLMHHLCATAHDGHGFDKDMAREFINNEVYARKKEKDRH